MPEALLPEALLPELVPPLVVERVAASCAQPDRTSMAIARTPGRNTRIDFALLFMEYPLMKVRIGLSRRMGATTVNVVTTQISRSSDPALV
jgi:hypothetical protein